MCDEAEAGLEIRLRLNGMRDRKIGKARLGKARIVLETKLGD
jgi:hypothetical protein